MPFQKLLRSFRSSVAATLGERGEFSLDDEIALYKKRAEAALREERHADGLVFLSKVLRLNPYDLSARMLVAETYHHALGEPTKAILTYEKVVAATAYDDSNSYCVRARAAIRELTAVFEAPAFPLHDLFEEENPQEESDGRAQSVAG